jgi:hypothetical protein
VAAFTVRALLLLREEWKTMVALERSMRALLLPCEDECSDTMPPVGYSAYMESSIFDGDEVVPRDATDPPAGFSRLRYWDSLAPDKVIRSNRVNTRIRELSQLWDIWLECQLLIYKDLLGMPEFVLGERGDDGQTVVERGKECTIQPMQILTEFAGETVCYTVGIDGEIFCLSLESVDSVFSSLCQRLELGEPLKPKGYQSMMAWDWHDLERDIKPIVAFERPYEIPACEEKHPWRQLIINLFIKRQNPQSIIVT